MTASHTAGPTPDEALRSVARRVVDAIDLAIDRGLPQQAQRLANGAMRLAVRFPRVADRIARLRLSQGDPEAALAIIDAQPNHSASMRLLRIACLIQLGQKAEAHLELHAWAQHSSAPPPVRHILALLDAAADDYAAAIATVTRDLQHGQDLAALELATVLCASQGRSQQAEYWAARLAEVSIADRAAVDVQLLCESLNLNIHRQPDQIQLAPKQLATLAMELIAAPQSLAILVQWQQTHFKPKTAQLIYSAAQRALPEMEESAPCYEALAHLAVLLGRADAALDWARRGLQTNPMSASLALLLAKLQQQHQPQPADHIARKAA